VRVGQGAVTLRTAEVATQAFEPGWRTRLLGAITHPNVALILLSLGVYGLLFEFLSPGAVLPGTIGAIAVLLGLYALSALPVNVAGLGLVILGLALLVAEAFSPSLGVLGLGGAVAFVLGATLLVDTDLPELQPSWPFLAGVAAFAFALTAWTARAAWQARRRPNVSGPDAKIGGLARVLDWSGHSGFVHFDGERWAAQADLPLRPGQQARVVARHGLCLEVTAIDPVPPQGG
jgi:membrane-bound serine protease (ClpP class)